MPCRATQNRQVMVESSDKMWSTGEGKGKPLQCSCLENPMNSMKRQKDKMLKDELPRSVQFSPVAESYLSLCDPMNRSMPGLRVHHHLPEFTQTHVHQVSDAISHLNLGRPLLLLPPIPPSIRVFSNESTLCMRWPKSIGVSALASVLPKNT